MSKPLDLSVLHVRAKAWAEKVHVDYYSQILAENPEKVGGNDAINRGTLEPANGLRDFESERPQSPSGDEVDVLSQPS